MDEQQSAGAMASGNAFDFTAHKQRAVSEYLKRRDYFVALAHMVERIVRECLVQRGIKVNSVDSRAKDAASFEEKAGTPSDADPNIPKYPNPLEQITDLAGVRVITFFPSTLDDIDVLIGDEFEIIERSDKGAALIAEQRFGYQSIHYLVRLDRKRGTLPEYQDFKGASVEIQVRTILQHAWAEIEHDIQYKSASVIPTEIRRRFMSLAGLLEIADREFQAIQDADASVTARAREQIASGNLDEVEVTPDALKEYLDRRLGPDRRISEFSYNWTARLLRNLGFSTMGQVDRCISGYDDNWVSDVAYSTRQGQTTRFELMLLASMGERYIQRHIFATQPWYVEDSRDKQSLEAFRSAGIKIGDYDPVAESKHA
ncbi:MAG TPA: hypothetical protein VMF11_08170 [Candidatus Baltobacteraceae bacterium]|nr:hypothetical protein [Candidatus Baltobacteraceae bacterium]